jgi:hypothetical protein
LARALYQNEDRAEIIDLGKVNFEGALNDVFGSRKGYVGSQDRAQFEEILLRNPEGGVIVFDEASNMGGEDKARKNALFKQGFYSLLDEGVWTSSATGTSYDLSKYTFIFTGNDGEKLFQGVSADDLRMATYNRNKSRGQVQKILIDAGLPEAFLGRMGDVVLMKPLLSTEVKQIAKNMLSEALKAYEERGLQFEVSPDFYDKVSKAFFSPDQGARSIRAMIDSSFKATLANLIVQGGGLQALKGKTIKIGLGDSLSPKPFIKNKEADRSVSLSLEIKGTGTVISSDLTSNAVSINKQSFRDARATAIHEAAHAIVNDPELTGMKLVYLTIVGSGEYLGYARYESAKTKSKAFTRESLVARVAGLIAGSRAQQMDGQPVDAGWSSDIQKARELISKGIIEYGLAPELRGVLYRDGKPQLTGAQSHIAAKLVEEILNEGDRLAQSKLRANWQLVRDVSAALLKKSSMSGEEFSSMLANSKPDVKVFDIRHGINTSSISTTIRCETVLLGAGK